MQQDQESHNQNDNSIDSTNSTPGVKMQPEVQTKEDIITYWQPNHQLKNGRYVINNILGIGGFGIAYLAEDGELKRSVVIKTLNERVQREPNFEKFKQDFKKEAQRLSRCHHDNVVLIYDMFDEGQLPCIVMQYITGETLAHRLERGVVIEENEALDYIHQIGAALEIVHQQSLVHRDVKPGNIMIQDGTNRAMLIDFGIAREFHLKEIIIQTIFVSASYAPPEQYLENVKKGPYTDIYALAATLYVLLTRQIPETAEIRARHIAIGKKDPLKPPCEINHNISEQVNYAILEGMKLHPDERPQTVQQWLDLLLSPNYESTSQHIHSISQTINEVNESPFNTEADLTIKPTYSTDHNRSDLPPIANENPPATPSQTQDLLLGGAFIGFTYGLLTSPLASFIFSQWIVTGLWILFIVGLMFAKCRGSFNFLSGKTLKFLSILVITAFVIILLLFGDYGGKFIILAMTFFSTGLSFLLMLVIPYLGIPRS
ncbi:serine/threonine protein kinase [Fischerella sp. NIES-4106]|nr:serine/threonine protein kinase [Fischerella sp. NIES-4106]